jgi:3-amino-5-hydroxybenzoate synthase
MYMFYYDPGYFGGLGRMEFVNALIAEGIPSYIGYPLIHKTAFYKENNFRGHGPSVQPRVDAAALVNAEKIADEVVWLPHFTLLGQESDVEEIGLAIRKIQKRYEK